MKKKILSLICGCAILFGSVSGLFSVIGFAVESNANQVLIDESDMPLKLLFDKPAPIMDSEYSHACDTTGKGIDIPWEQYSLPIGNAHFGVNVFGRTETERIQVTEKTLYHPFSYSPDSGGLNNFSETFIDFNHTYENVSDYERYLDLTTATTGVNYTYNGVKYSRELFASYPDKVFVIKLSADTDGALSFTLRPTIPFEQDYMYEETDGKSKNGTVTSSVTEDGVGYIELEGLMGAHSIDFLGIYKVYSDGDITASTVDNNYTDFTGKEHTDVDGTIVVNGAKNAYIVVTLGTDYELIKGTFNNSTPPTVTNGPEYTRAKVGGEMSAIDAIFEGKNFEEAYNLLKSNHIEDHSKLFGRVSVDLDCDENDFKLTTETLISNYQTNGYGTYLEVLLFQYGRYLLIASSRDGTLPANLQGVWNSYNTPSLGSGYWHNINVQMNYWPAFSTNLAETFEAYVDYNNAYMPAAEGHAWVAINKFHPELLGKDGGNGWVIGVAQHGFTLAGDYSCGDLGFTTQMFWDYYQFTKDPEVLAHVYDVLVSAARYITKIVEIDEDGKYLVPYSNSPEVKVNGAWYYTKGTTYAQTFAYLNNYNALAAAKALGIDLENEELLSGEDYSVLKTIMEQIDKYDPIQVGLSGQIKEFREETYYSSIGDDPSHRHVSMLVGLYPGNIINSSTPAWLDAAKVSLEGRSGGDTAGGWVLTHKNNLYARLKDGEKAHEMVQGMLSRCTFPNLFTKIYGLFQIDSNFGYTAGVAEMLLQSHEGYIEPLAAMPEAWSDGSYTGLVARGNFEVSAAWQDGVADTFNIKSGSGGVAKVYYPSITGAKVTVASTGREVKYEVLDDHLIGFDTTEGETYIISGFEKIEKPTAPEVLNYSREGDFGDFTLVWSPAADAIGYNVYAAIDNAPTYTLIKNTTATSLVYTPDKENDNERMTFVVTSVNEDGVETERTLCYYNPIDTAATVSQVMGYVTDSGELQAVVKSNSNTVSYRLYEKASGQSEYTLLCETKAPVLCTSYSSDKEYAVSVLSYHHNEESELYKIGSITRGKVYENIFKDKVFVQEADSRANAADGYAFSKLTDGVICPSDYRVGRYSSGKNTAAEGATPTNIAAATIDLNGEYVLNELQFNIYDKNYQHIGTNFKVDVFANGEWVTVIDNLSYDDMVQNNIRYIVNPDDSTGKSYYWLVFDLGGIKASKLRFHADPLSGQGMTFYEAVCYGTLVETNFINVLEGKEIIGTEAIATNSTLDSKAFDYDKLNDGIMSNNWKLGRYVSASNGKFNATVDLEGRYAIDELRLYMFRDMIGSVGHSWKIEAYLDGAWTTVKSIATNDEMAALIVTQDGTSLEDKYVSIDLGGIVAEKLRFSASAVSGDSVSLVEMRCYGALDYVAEEFNNIFEEKEFAGATATDVSGSYTFGYDKLTDGVLGTSWQYGRFSSRNGLDGTINLGKVYKLNTLKIYSYELNQGKITTAGQNWKIEVYLDGVWKTVKTIATNEELSALVVKTGGTTPEDYWISINLGGVYAEKIRLTADVTSLGYVSLQEIRCSAIPADYYAEYCDNVLDGYQFVSNKAVAGSVYRYEKLTDNVISATYNIGRYSSPTDGVFEATLEFDKVHVLDKMKFYIFNKQYEYTGENWKIEVYYDGAWRTVKTIATNAEFTALKTGNGGTGLEDEWIEVNLSGVAAEKIRMSATSVSGKGITFTEIRCTGYEMLNVCVDRSAMIEAYEKVASLKVSGEEHSAKLELFREYLTDYKVSEENATTYAEEMNAYYETTKNIVSSIDFALKTSITLDENIILNVYVPAVSTLVKFTLDGVEYSDLNAIRDTKVLIGEKEYYRIQIMLSAKAAAKDIPFVVTLNHNGNNVSGRYTLGVVKYAQALIETGSSVEKQLIKDVLSYIKAAYVYFGIEDDVAFAKIDALLGEQYDASNAPVVEGNTTHETNGLKSVTFLLDETPSMRFTLEDGADASKYAFFINGRPVKTVISEDGKSIDMDVYAYQLCETVTYTYTSDEGVVSGSFHINAYYEWSKTQNNEKLVNVVARFWKYLQSARAYRESVVEN
ncbi:MAG: glycoside hydrolase N-terminal domain-containing protein [Clostridia bacterium]|nr:glycoside hydrolase N-terminal domain-containing protein [Clostridia bacterium]